MSLHHKYWIVVADASKAKIFASSHSLLTADKDLSFVQELDHAASRLETHELESDAQGRYKTHEAGGSAYQPKTDAHEDEKINFKLLIYKVF